MVAASAIATTSASRKPTTASCTVAQTWGGNQSAVTSSQTPVMTSLAGGSKTRETHSRCAASSQAPSTATSTTRATAVSRPRDGTSGCVSVQASSESGAATRSGAAYG